MRDRFFYSPVRALIPPVCTGGVAVAAIPAVSGGLSVTTSLMAHPGIVASASIGGYIVPASTQLTNAESHEAQDCITPANANAERLREILNINKTILRELFIFFLKANDLGQLYAIFDAFYTAPQLETIQNIKARLPTISPSQDENMARSATDDDVPIFVPPRF